MRLCRWQFAAVLLVLTMPASGQTVPPDHAKSRLPPCGQARNAPYQPITDSQRMKWFLQSTIGPQSLAAGIFSAGFGTALNAPKEYGGTWEGFGKRYGMRLTGVSTGNAIEAGFGAEHDLPAVRRPACAACGATVRSEERELRYVSPIWIHRRDVSRCIG